MVTPRYEPRLPKLQIELPYRIAGLEFAFVEDYNREGELAGQGAGISLRYEAEADFSHADLFEYDWNHLDLPDGILSHAVIEEFFQLHSELRAGLDSGYYTSLTTLEQRIAVAPGAEPSPAGDPDEAGPPAQPHASQDPDLQARGPGLEWLMTTCLADMPRPDSETSPPLRADQHPGLGPLAGGDPDEDQDEDTLPDYEGGGFEEDVVLVHAAVTAFGGQFIKLRYTHFDDDDPALEQGFFDFLNQLSSQLLQHRKR